MKRPLQKLGTAVVVLMTILLVNITYIQVVKSDAYRSDPNNTRTLLEEYNRQRGQITAAGGVVLARSDPSTGQYRYQRVYPGGATYANLTGFYSLRYGATGLERTYNDVLNGDDPNLIVDRLSDLITGRDPRGGNVELTVVPAVQKAAYQGLVSRGYVGAVVALQPKTGAILAMATSPSYNPNPLASHSEATQRKAYNALVAPTDASAPSPLLNRPIQAVYPPGSTFKQVVSAGALQHGYTPKTMVTGDATITLPGTGGATLSNYNNETCADAGGAEVTLTEAFAHSCNTAFAEVGMDIGADVLRDQAAAFGIDGRPSDVGLPVVGSRVGAMADDAAVAQSSIGQRDVAITPLANAIVAATIANGGERMNPYLVNKVTKPDLSVMTQTQPSSEGQAIPQSVADQLRGMMIQSEKDMTGGGMSGLVVASKTGTAEHGVDSKNTPPHTWYVAFAPADNPQVAVAVLVENGGDKGLAATGATVAAPIGHEVIAAAVKGGS